MVRYSANTNAGIANVTVQGKGNYTGTAVLHFKINQKSLNDSDVSVRCTPTAKRHATIKATYKGKTLRQNKDYTVSIATSGTTRTVTVQGKGNFNSRRQFKIHVHAYKCTAKKAATYFATGYKKYKCTACGQKDGKAGTAETGDRIAEKQQKGRLTVKWKKGSGISGYQISYSTSSKFTKSTTKSVTITKAGSTAKTLTKLKSKKKVLCAHSGV